VALSVDLPGAASLAAGAEPLTVAVEELLANLDRHVTDPTVRVSVVTADGPTEGRIDDHGPGIPETERATVLSGEETPLAHGTGLGLWLVQWLTTVAGGQLVFGDNDLGGARVTLSFPASDADADDQDPPPDVEP
jgi:K+-sensing histidine kinase KdpD